MGTTEATQTPQAPTLTIPAPAPASESMGVEPNRYGAPQAPAQTPILAATSPSIAGMRTVPDLRMRRLMGVSAWALALGSSGFVLGAIAMIRLMGDVPGWFEPVFAATGVFGLALVITAFITVQFRRIPWLLLGASTVTFIIGVILLGNV